MSSSIDSRIVQMQFDNSQFEKGVATSLKTLEELKKSLEFDKYERELKNLQDSGNSFSLLKMANSIDVVADRFTTLGVIGTRALQRLTDKALDFGEKFVKSITIDQVSRGFDKYADKTKAVQTIMAATGEDIDTVSEQLDRLATYTDETSYSFTEMVSSIGKFTSVGMGLEDSVTAMEGIANWAAISGQGVAEANRAMYNLSQSLGMGSVKLMDWKSIENANMATKEFKETAIETAIAMGVLDKKAKASKGTAVNFQNFRETLNQGWLNNDVLMETLKIYGEYGDEVMRVMAERNISCAEAMELVSDEFMDLGARAFRAAQEAKTFKEAIDATTDAVSTKWMKIFEAIFGNYEEAKVLWTKLANDLYDIFVEPLNSINDLLYGYFDENGDWVSGWKELGGYEDLVYGLSAAMEALKGVIQGVKDAFHNMFPETTADDLLNITDKVRNLGTELRKVVGIKT